MSRRILLLVALGLALGSIAPSLASALPMAWFQVGNGQTFYINQEDWLQGNDGYWYMSFSKATSNFRLTGSAVAKEDPYISYSFTAVNLSANALTFNYGILAPINPPVIAGNTVYSSFSGSWTDPRRDGITITPTLGDQDGDGFNEIVVNELNGVNMGVDVGTGFTQAGGYSGPNSGLFGGPPYDQGPTAGPAGNWTQLGVRLGFTMTGRNDTATMNGYTSIVPVPEPASLMLLGGGLLGLAVAYRRRKP